jgi:hypothetical protein
MRNNHRVFLLLIMYSSSNFTQEQEEMHHDRNPFCFAHDAHIVEIKKIEKIEAIQEEKHVQLINTETKWQVKTILPSRELALTATHISS